MLLTKASTCGKAIPSSDPTQPESPSIRWDLIPDDLPVYLPVEVGGRLVIQAVGLRKILDDFLGRLEIIIDDEYFNLNDLPKLV